MTRSSVSISRDVTVTMRPLPADRRIHESEDTNNSQKRQDFSAKNELGLGKQDFLHPVFLPVEDQQNRSYETTHRSEIDQATLSLHSLRLRHEINGETQ